MPTETDMPQAHSKAESAILLCTTSCSWRAEVNVKTDKNDEKSINKLTKDDNIN
jgi:hypothetical protein